MPTGPPHRRILFVHAHPDDEAIATGATMAKYAADGVHVALVTCTLGEEGEILVPELEHLGATDQDALGDHRVGELTAAMKELGISDFRFLGGRGRFRDSGMMGTPSNDRPDSFWQADLDEAARELVPVVREVRPQVIVTYDENGAYGHPDHIKAHQVAMAAFDKAADPDYAPGTGEPWQPQKLYYTVVARRMLQEAMDIMRKQGKALFEGMESADDVPFAVDEEQITAEIDARDFFEVKFAALRAYPTQITADDPLFSLADGALQQGFGVEHYILARGERGPGQGPYDWETDLFAGIKTG